MLLHGGSIDNSGLSWDTCRKELAARHTVICPDLPGFGRSFPLTQPCTARFLIRCVGELIEKEIAGPVSLVGLSLGGLVAMGCALERPRLVRSLAGPVSLVGLSLGGLVAMGCALERPRLVRSLILVNSLGLVRRLAWNPIAWLGGKVPATHIRLGRLASRSDLGARIALRFFLNRKPSTKLVARVRGCLAMNELLATGWRSFLSQEATLRGFRTCFEDHLERIRVPVLQIHGATDRLIPTWHGIQSQPLFPDSELEIIPECGHWLPREEPGLFCELVARFLDQRGLMDS